MTWISQIAYHQNIRNEEPNKALAKLIAATENTAALEEIAGFLHDKNRSIASDVLATMYHVGYEKPELLVPYLEDFVGLLSTKNNRMVWGSMIALSTIAKVVPSQVVTHLDRIISTIEKGSVITEVWGLATLVHIVVSDAAYDEKIHPVLLIYLKKCRPIDFAKRVEKILPIVKTYSMRDHIKEILDEKSGDLSDAQRKKLMTILRRHDKKSEYQFLR